GAKDDTPSKDGMLLTRRPSPDSWGPLRPPRSDRLPSDTPLSPAFAAPVAGGAAVSTDPLSRDETLAAFEAILLLADEPLPVRKIAQVAGLADAAEARRALKKLQGLLAADGSAFQIEEVAGGFQLLTRGEFHRWLASLRRGQQETRLSGPARETLAIVAY